MADLFGVVRRLLWFIIGLAIAAVWLVPSARSETCTASVCTEPATAGTGWVSPSYYAPYSESGNHFTDSSLAERRACELSVGSGSIGAYSASGGRILKSYGYGQNWVRSGPTSTCEADVRVTCPGGSTYTTGSTVNFCSSSAVYSCPSTGGWTLSGSNCTRPACAANQGRDTAGVCKDRCDGDTIDQYAGRQIAGGMAYTKGMQFCVNGCRYFSETIGSKAGVVTGATLGGGTGQACDASHIGSGTATTGEPTATQADSDAAKCIKAGQEYGTVSGKTVCTAPMSTKEVTKKTTDGKVNPDATTPSSTREETSVCKDGKCTVEVKVTNSGGGTETGTSPSDGNCVAGQNGVTTCTKTQDQQSFCAEHPTDPQCKEQTTFGGSCAPGAQPTCTGDAVQCEQARAAWKIECDLTEEPTDAQYTLGKSLATGGADPVVSPLDPSKLTTVNVTDLVTTAGAARTLTASCIPNQTFTVMSQSYTFDTTLFCQFASIIGYLMVAASSVIAIRMVVSGGSV